MLQALHGSNAPKSYVRKVSKQVALACVKHTLTRCWKFEECSISCLDASMILHCRICTLQETMIPSLLMVFDQELLVMKLCIKLNLEDQVCQVKPSHAHAFALPSIKSSKKKINLRIFLFQTMIFAGSVSQELLTNCLKF